MCIQPSLPSQALLSSSTSQGSSQIASLALDGSLAFRALIELSEDGLYAGKGLRMCAALQLLEINLIQTPQVADAILANGVLTHYDRPR